jgi:gliding motility-associated-like protein
LNDQGQAVAPGSQDLLNAACPGDYFLEVTDIQSGCSNYYQVKVGEPDTIGLSANIIKNISCFGACDGEIFINTTGGNLLYTYSWDDPTLDGIPVTDLCAGVYAVTATDANGCSASTTVTLTDPPVLNLTILSFSTLDCSSDCDATANVSASGGTAPYIFNWSGGQSGTNPTDLCFGPNIVTITDATGCEISDTVFIGAIDTVVANVPANNIICEGDSIRLKGDVFGSTVTFAGWYDTDTNLFTTNLDTTIFRPLGTYNFFLIARNGNGCHDTTLYDANVVGNPVVDVVSPIRIYKDEVAQIDVRNDQSTFIYNWTPTDFLSDSTIAEPIASPRENYTYYLTVTDPNGCTYIDSVRVIYSPEINIPSGFTPNGDGVNDVWNLQLLEEFPNADVQIYNRWGELLYEQKNGYRKAWDGTYEGKALPVGTYYYIIDMKTDRFDPITGPITIVR